MGMDCVSLFLLWNKEWKSCAHPAVTGICRKRSFATDADRLRASLQGRRLPVARPQRDALIAAGVDARQTYSDRASGKNVERPGLEVCLKALREGDVLVVWKLDRLGRSLHHLVKTVTLLSERSIGLKVLTGQGAAIDTTTAAGRLCFGIFAALAEFESDLIRERTMAGLQAARARGRKGGRTFTLTKAQVRTIQAAMAHRDTSVSQLCRELGITPVTLYRYVDPQGNLRDHGKRVLGA